MNHAAGDRGSNTQLSNGVEATAGTNSDTTTSSANNDQASQSTTSATQSGQNMNSSPNPSPDTDEVRADRLLRLVLAILRGGSDESASRLVEAIRQNARERSDEVDLRGVAESAIRICRDDPGVQEELSIVEALLQDLGEDAIYTRFPT